MANKIPKYMTYVTASIKNESQLDDDKAKQLDSVRASLEDFIPQLYRDKQVDLAYIDAIQVSVGDNTNDDVFVGEELFAAIDTIPLKPINSEHNKEKIIGVMYRSDFVDAEFKIKAREEISDALANDENYKFHILSNGVLYKFIYPDEVEEIVAGANEGKKFVSMECYFDGFDYKYGDDIVDRNEHTDFLFPYLRAFGGSGVFNGKTVKRVLRKIMFSGQGIVAHPANKDSFILSIASEQLRYIKIQKKHYRPVIVNGMVVSLASYKDNIYNEKEEIDTDNVIVSYDNEYYRYILTKCLAASDVVAWVDEKFRVVDLLRSNIGGNKLISDMKAKYLIKITDSIASACGIGVGATIDINPDDNAISMCLIKAINGVYNNSIANSILTVKEESMDIEMLKKENESLKAELEKAFAAIKQFEGQEVNKKIEALSSDIKSRDEKVSALEKTVAEMTEKQTSLVTELESKGKEIETLSSSIKAEIDKVAEIEKQKAELVAQIEKVESEKIMAARTAELSKYDLSDKQLEVVNAEVAAINYKDADAFTKYVGKLALFTKTKEQKNAEAAASNTETDAAKAAAAALKGAQAGTSKTDEEIAKETEAKAAELRTAIVKDLLPPPAQRREDKSKKS
jgi:hypothetical protein